MNKIFAAIVLTVITVQSQATERLLVDFVVIDENAIQANLTELAPMGQWVLIVLDAYTHSSDHLLQLLEDNDLVMANTVVLELHNRENQYSALQAAHAKVEPYAWFTSTTLDAFSGLNIAGTPVVMGLQNTHIIWQRSGVPDDLGKALIHQIRQWSVQEG